MREPTRGQDCSAMAPQLALQLELRLQLRSWLALVRKRPLSSNAVRRLVRRPPPWGGPPAIFAAGLAAFWPNVRIFASQTPNAPTCEPLRTTLLCTHIVSGVSTRICTV